VAKPLRVPLQGLEPGLRELDGPAAHYVSRVHRLAAGDPIVFFDAELATEADARLVAVGKSSVSCLLEPARPSGYRAYPIRLLQGLGKAGKPDLVIRDATALGVAHILFIDTERAVAHVSLERAGSRLQRWKRIATEAARQCGRGNLPGIEGPLPFTLALGQPGGARRVLLSPNGPPLLDRFASARAGDSTDLLVGPEGGLSSAEMGQAEAAGFLPASLGPTTLRTELAALAALGALVALSDARGLR
jgi:16S rRNA (uracil1498-N3)-methyltransferase